MPPDEATTFSDKTAPRVVIHRLLPGNCSSGLSNSHLTQFLGTTYISLALLLKVDVGRDSSTTPTETSIELPQTSGAYQTGRQRHQTGITSIGALGLCGELTRKQILRH